MKVEHEEEVSYTWALRSVGAYLDEHKAQKISLLEVPEGIVATYSETSENGPDRAMMPFTIEEMVQYRSEMEHQRVASLTHGRDVASPPHVLGAAGYQDLLRALGWELDDTRAYNILVREMDDQFMLTYEYLDPRDNYLPYKRLLMLGADEIGLLMTEAYERRKLEPAPSILGRLRLRAT
jgi:hypothetical protein